jgi:hypothetical protein
MTATTRKGGKKLSVQAGIGQQGINLIERIVLQMGSAWHPGNASLDAGIDGQIELIDPVSREATNAIIRVQGKATSLAFPKETVDSFEWPCDERDLDYWMSGNAPVILVVARPKTDEAYWVSVKDYFNTPARQKTKRVLFDRRTMRFTPTAASALFALAVPKNVGIYFSPRPRQERIFSNLLTVTGLPDRLWQGETELHRPDEIFLRLRQAGVHAPEFVLRNKRILTIHNLTEPPWSTFVDRGTVEDFSAVQWAQSDDADTVRRFVELLNYCLSARARQIGCDRRQDDGMYYYRATADLSTRVVPYRSVMDQTKRDVFKAYPYKKGDRIGEISYYRHSAFYGQFLRYDTEWFLEVTPTYFFTLDGYRRHPFYESKLKGIKALEKNGTVLGQVVMWAALLRGRDEDDEGLFFRVPYAPLRFGPLNTFSLSVGIDDDAWLPNEETVVAKSVRLTANDLPLFQEADPYAAEEDGADDVGGTGEHTSFSGDNSA